METLKKGIYLTAGFRTRQPDLEERPGVVVHETEAGNITYMFCIDDCQLWSHGFAETISTFLDTNSALLGGVRLCGEGNAPYAGGSYLRHRDMTQLKRAIAGEDYLTPIEPQAQAVLIAIKASLAVHEAALQKRS